MDCPVRPGRSPGGLWRRRGLDQFDFDATSFIFDRREPVERFDFTEYHDSVSSHTRAGERFFSAGNGRHYRAAFGSDRNARVTLPFAGGWPDFDADGGFCGDQWHLFADVPGHGWQPEFQRPGVARR